MTMAARAALVGTVTCLTLPLLGAAVPQGAAAPIRADVVRVLDGHTLEVKITGRTEIVRHIGIGTPVISHPTHGPEPYANRAAAAHAEIVLGRQVTLRPDGQFRDAAGRYLADVVIDDMLVAAELVRRGFAEVQTVPPHLRRRQQLLTLQAQAQAERMGLWGDPEVWRFYRPARSGVLASRRTMSFFHVDDDKAYLEDSREPFESPEAAAAAGYVPSFEYAFHAERERRRGVAVTSTSYPFAPYAGSAARPVAAPAQPVALPRPDDIVGHTWRGGVFVPIRRQ